jgi:NAD(P)-dependent dehydrogenase (short-subunit alcohol dehydrogenase family)
MTARSSASRVVDKLLEATVVGSFTKIGFDVRSRLEEWRDPSDAGGRTVVITGATAGLGLAMATRLAGLGANVTLVGRNQNKIDDALAVVCEVARGRVEGHRCDLSVLADAKELAEKLTASSSPLDVFIHNAGSLLSKFTPTSEDVETTLATHLLSPYLLTERLIASRSFALHARIITMTSGGMYTEKFNLSTLEMNQMNYQGTVAYARAKRAQTVMVAHWQRTYGPSDLAFHLVHPGWAATKGVSEGIPGFERVMRPLLRSADQGADTAVWLAGSPDGSPKPGLLWLDRHPRSLHRVPRTRLSPSEERAAERDLPRWCDERISRALTRD